MTWSTTTIEGESQSVEWYDNGRLQSSKYLYSVNLACQVFKDLMKAG